MQERARRSTGARRIVSRLQRAFTRIDRSIYRHRGCSLGGRAAHAETLLLRTTGRCSGADRTTPLVYVRHGADFLVVAANGGAPWNPHWLANLGAEPRAVIEFDGRHRDQRQRRTSNEQNGEPARHRFRPPCVIRTGDHASVIGRYRHALDGQRAPRMRRIRRPGGRWPSARSSRGASRFLAVRRCRRRRADVPCS